MSNYVKMGTPDPRAPNAPQGGQVPTDSAGAKNCVSNQLEWGDNKLWE
eukprot:gene18424-5908_t